MAGHGSTGIDQYNPILAVGIISHKALAFDQQSSLAMT